MNATRKLFSGNEHARWVEGLPDAVVFEYAEADAFDELGDALFDLAAPEGRGDFAEDAVDGVKHGCILTDQDKCQMAAIPEDAAEFAESADDIVG